MMDDVSSSPPAEDSYPVANVQSVRSPKLVAGIVVSRLWLATGLCLLVAILLVWTQVRSKGPTIEIHFSEGHGLQPGDPVRYRGIDIGQVEGIFLSDELDGVLVLVELAGDAARLACEGSRFWIERPSISVGQVQGLDTLVGGRFVGVVPGPVDARPSRIFYGLEAASAPIDDLAKGLEIVLESTHRLGLQSGSSVSYRGVTVGHVLSVGLSNDAATVEARAYIRPEYRELIRVGTQFWSNSGLDVSIGLGGIEFDVESLATIAAGGVSLATPNVPGRLASTGYRFELFESPLEEWSEWQPRLGIGSDALPEGVSMPRPLLGIRREQGALALLGAGRQRGWLLSLGDGRLLGPANILRGEGDGEYLLELSGQEFSLPLAGLKGSGSLAYVTSPDLADDPISAWPLERIRVAKQPEAVVVTCGSDEATMSVSIQRLTTDASGWVVDPSVPLDDSWHGACVVAASDGYVIGILIRSGDRSRVVLLTEDFL